MDHPPVFPELELHTVAEHALELRLTGPWSLHQPRPSTDPLTERLRASPGLQRLTFDTSGLQSWDTTFLTFLARVEQLATTAGLEVDTTGLPEGVRRLRELAAAVPEREGARRSERHTPWLEHVGNRYFAAYEGFDRTLTFLGEMTIGFTRMLTGRARYRRSDLMQFLSECGAGALPIVALLGTLIGLILAFVGAIQLKMFGAEVYVADLVGVGMAMEMGALITGIVMAGRTGAAFAAQLGTMQVNEEIDALRTLGISPFEFLVLPRMLALILMMPLLCLFADVLGIFGGAVVGIGTLDITPAQYFNQTANAVQLSHFVQGLIKSVVFGVVIAVGGCLQGINCGRSAQAVGEATTKAVVQCIVWIVVTDATLTVIFSTIGF